ncbi:MAG: HU family DNA-binding protein [Oscillospiraceae bacterium]|jgi:DNA-binding protein HU-beta|nr:HU family DNA-binding protein [Oscillospiraceae bacterium]
MTKSDLIASVAESASIKKTQATTVVGAVFDTITQALAEGDKVQIVGFGSFEVRERAERNGRDPRSGEVITIAATKAPVFKAGSALKEAVKD